MTHTKFSFVLVVQIPRGAVKRVPIKQELSPDELAQLREQASAEEAAKMREDNDSDGDDSSSDEGAKASKKGKGKKANPLDDPAFASLRDVALPEGMELELDDEDDMGDDDDDSSDDGNDEEKAAARSAKRKEEQRRRDAALARAQQQLDAQTLGDRMADIDAPAAFDDDENEEDSDAEDLTAQPSDCFVLVANTEEEYSNLEVHCYNAEDGSLYVHHDITLPAFPVCLAWMDYAGSASANASLAAQRAAGAGAAIPLSSGSGTAGMNAASDPAATVGSYVAVGTFKPDIEIWNCDVRDPLEPSLVLKGAPGSGGKPGQGKKGSAKAAGALAAATAPGSVVGHADTVMGLGWNRAHRHLLASASADKTVKIWDLDGKGGAGAVLHTYTHHKGKVASVAWNPVETSVLATASYDRTISVTDARASDKTRIARYGLPADPEALQWNVHNPAAVLAACEDGSIISYDVRVPDKPLWHVTSAHAGAVTSLAQSALARGLLATGSLDKSVKLWDTLTSSPAASTSGGGGKSKGTSGGAPVCIAGKAMTIGQVFSVSFFPNAPFLLAAGGSKGVLAVWDIETDGGEVPPGAPPMPAGSANATVEGLLALDASATAKRFSGRLVTDPAAIPGNPLAIRQRLDGQQC